MQILLTETKATETKKLQNKRNLFGLGLTSLIAACSGADGAGGGGGSAFTSTLDFKAKKLLEPENLAEAKALAEDQAGGYTAEIETSTSPTFMGGTDDVDVKITKPDASVLLKFPMGGQVPQNRAGIYTLTDAAQYDLVISVPAFDRNDINGDRLKGKIFIYWNVEGVTNSSAARLEIKGGAKTDRIGEYAPEFLQLGGVADKGGTPQYDMVIRSEQVENPDGGSNNADNEGAIYVLWDVKSYLLGASFDLSDAGLAGATAGSLAIYGANTGSNGGVDDDMIGIHVPNFLKIGGEDGYDMVIRSHLVDSTGRSSDDPGKGAIYVLWDINFYYKNGTAIIANKKIDLEEADTGPNYATAGLLTIKGAAVGDQIGTRAPEFLQLGGAENNHDMVIRSDKVGSGSTDNATLPGNGAIYILWDVEDYKTGSIILNDSAEGVNDAGLLTIKGAAAQDSIGIHAPEFLQLGGKDDNYDMVIRSEWVDNITSASPPKAGKGAIYILWDVEEYAGENTDIILNDSAEGVKPESGLLTIKGAAAQDSIGIHAPEFLQLGGKDDNYDMVIRSEWVDNISASTPKAGKGAIYILWDVEDYKTAAITLNSSATGVNDAGLLTIKGALAGDQGTIAGDQIGIHETEFLQLGKENDKYDLIIRSEHVDNGNAIDAGAIYVLWDVADYAGGNETIDLATVNASSSLLTIYGATAGSMLGSSNVLYKADNEDSDVDGDGTNDLVFKDGSHTYVLFGDQLGAVNAGTGKVASKTIDLSQIQVDAKGFFGNDVDKELGYRFASGTGSGADGKGGYTFAEVKDVFSPSLSDADADLGVWDIA